MPCYKTHSIHGELIYSEINKNIDININDIKTFCIGPDLLVLSDYSLFNYQHYNKTKDYFETMIKIIKKNHLYENSEVMSFLYGQLDHLVLDATAHPYIYYMTEGIKSNKKINSHTLVEHWIDDYISNKYDKNEMNYYSKWKIKEIELNNLIDKVYKNIYKKNNISSKYNIGIKYMKLYDLLLRNRFALITRFVDKTINLGDITYSSNLEKVLPFLNIDHNEWYNPETNEQYFDSFDDIWNKSLEISKDTINDVNRFLYKDGILTNNLIQNNTSYNTGLPCEKGQTNQYIRRYKNNC